jgi:hypothetical protein
VSKISTTVLVQNCCLYFFYQQRFSTRTDVDMFEEYKYFITHVDSLPSKMLEFSATPSALCPPLLSPLMHQPCPTLSITAPGAFGRHTPGEFTSFPTFRVDLVSAVAHHCLWSLIAWVSSLCSLFRCLFSLVRT